MASDQHPSERQRSGGVSCFLQAGQWWNPQGGAVSTQERKKPTQAGATADPEDSLVWGVPLLLELGGLL